MGKNYRPSIKQAALEFGISPELLQHLVEMSGIKSTLSDKEVSLYKLDELEEVVTEYHTGRDRALVLLFREVAMMRKELTLLTTELQLARVIRDSRKKLSLTQRKGPSKLSR